MKIFIKNMVCQGTKSFVLLEMRKLGLTCKTFKLGEVDFDDDLPGELIKELDNSLRKYGLEVTFSESKLVSEIRNVILDLVENDIKPGTRFPNYIIGKVGHQYSFLNNYFTSETGLPIEEYYLEKREEKERLNEPKWADALNQISESHNRAELSYSNIYPV
jgi:hypothetical protein